MRERLIYWRRFTACWLEEVLGPQAFTKIAHGYCRLKEIVKGSRADENLSGIGRRAGTSGEGSQAVLSDRLLWNFGAWEDIVPFLRRHVAPLSLGRSYPLVSIIVLNRNGEHHLRRLLPSLRAYTIYPNYEVIVVDNDSTDGSTGFVRSFPMERLRLLQLSEPLSFSAANNKGAEEAQGQILVFLNNDTEVCYGWLWQLVRTLEADPEAACVGSTLIYPELTELDKAGDWILPGFSVQHSGIAFRDEGDFLRPYNKGRFLHPLRVSVKDALQPAVTGAAMAWRAEVFRRLKGFDEGYRFGYEDVDLCLRAWKEGYRTYVSGRSFVIHHEFGTQKHTDRITKRANRLNNMQRFSSRWVPTLQRAYWQEKLFGRPFLAEHPFTIAITVTEYHPATTCGDYFTATGLGRALERLGYRVLYLARRPLDEWYRIPADVDLLLVMMDDYELPKAKVRPGLLTCAWVRNWVDRWGHRPWLQDYDMVLTSSRKSLQALRPVISTRSTTGVLRIAVDADLFRPRPADPRYECDLCFVGNIFHVPRDIVKSLRLDPSWRFRFWGRLEVPSHPFQPYHEGRVPYEEVPKIYNSAKIVLEDCTPMCRPWGCINSRTFEAAACGACIISNPVPELEELFGDAILTYRSPQELSQLIRHYLSHEEERAALGRKARQVVLDAHTYDHRARELRDLVAGHLGLQGVARFEPKEQVEETPKEHGSFFSAFAAGTHWGCR